jgi:hypothetical protein
MTRIPGESLEEIRGLMPEGIFSAFKELRASLERESTLDVPLRELLRLKAAELAGCRH